MSHLDCPHCGKPAITALRKVLMGPALPATCRVCGRKVGVRYSTTMKMNIIVGLTLIALVAVTSFASFVMVLAGGATLWVFVQIWWVPLVPR